MAKTNGRVKIEEPIILTQKEIIGRTKDKIQLILNRETKVKAKNESQKELIRSLKDKEITICTGPAGSGKTFVSLAFALGLLRNSNNNYKKIYLVKSVTTLRGEELGFLKGPQPIYEKILTPNGWVKMGDINIGDYVIGDDGKKTKVISTNEYDEEDIYRITLRDGRFVDSSLEHKWNIKTKKLDFFTVDTNFILNNYKNNDLYLPDNNIVEYENNKILNIPPYVLGVLIGDGSITNEHVRFTSIDDNIINRVKKEIDELGLKITKNNISYNITSKDEFKSIKGSKEIKITNVINNEVFLGGLKEIKNKLNINNAVDTTIVKRCNKKSIINDLKYEYTGNILGFRDVIKETLKDLNLLNLKAWEKFIPKNYLFSSIEERIALLQGLLDTDGSIKPNGEITYTTTSENLANNTKELVLSLGGNGRIYSYEPKNKKQVLNGNKVIQRRKIYVVYIKFNKNIFNPFFLKRKAERFKTLTYINTNKIINLEKLPKKEKIKCITVDNKSNLYYTKDFIITHNSLTEKFEPFMMSFVINMEKMIEDSEIKNLFDSDIIRPFPLAYIRGASLDDSIIIADEMQNVSLDNARTLLTRIGSNSKMIILGDTNQIDMKNKEESSLEPLLNMFNDVEEIGCVRMSEDDTNVRNPIISKIEANFKKHYNDVKPISNERRRLKAS